MKKLFLFLALIPALHAELNVLDLKNTYNACPPERQMLSPISGALAWQSPWLYDALVHDADDCAALEKLVQQLFFGIASTKEIGVSQSTSDTPYVLKLYGLSHLLARWYLEDKELMDQLVGWDAHVRAGVLTHDEYEKQKNYLFEDADKARWEYLNKVCFEDLGPWRHGLHRVGQRSARDSEVAKSLRYAINRFGRVLAEMRRAFVAAHQPDAQYSVAALEQALVAFWFACQEPQDQRDAYRVLDQYMHEVIFFDTKPVEWHPDSYTAREVCADALVGACAENPEKIALLVLAAPYTAFSVRVGLRTLAHGAEMSSNCGESTLHNLVNFLLYCPERQSYDVSLLPAEVQEHVHPKVREFYARWTPEHTLDAACGQEWFELIASLKTEETPFFCAEKTCGVFGDEVNIVHVFNALLGTNYMFFEDLARLSTPTRVITISRLPAGLDWHYCVNINGREAYVALERYHASLCFRARFDSDVLRGAYERTRAWLSEHCETPFNGVLARFCAEQETRFSFKKTVPTACDFDLDDFECVV